MQKTLRRNVNQSQTTNHTCETIGTEQSPREQYFSSINRRFTTLTIRIELCRRKSGGHTVDFDPLSSQLVRQSDGIRISSRLGCIVCYDVERRVRSRLVRSRGHIGGDIENDGLRGLSEEWEKRRRRLDQTEEVGLECGAYVSDVDRRGTLRPIQESCA
jgi:hypothetical protein